MKCIKTHSSSKKTHCKKNKNDTCTTGGSQPLSNSKEKTSPWATNVATLGFSWIHMSMQFIWARLNLFQPLPWMMLSPWLMTLFWLVSNHQPVGDPPFWLEIGMVMPEEHICWSPHTNQNWWSHICCLQRVVNICRVSVKTSPGWFCCFFCFFWPNLLC